jgi:PAB-dependent poly(A)-specific ribonuclease subunit 2
MPHYTEPLLSNFPPADYAPVTSPFFNPPEPIPTSVLSSMKVLDFVGYATLPRELRGKRYVVTACPGAGKLATGKGFVNGRRDSAPRFRSEKDRQREPTVEEEASGAIFRTDDRHHQERYRSTTARSRSSTPNSALKILTLVSTTTPSTLGSRPTSPIHTPTPCSRLCTISHPYAPWPRHTSA